jgi:hypothetical protein
MKTAMKKTIYSLLAMGALTGVSIDAHAYNSYNETYNVMGCSSYMVSRDQTRGWLIGYLNGLETQNNTRILYGKDPSVIYRAIDRYCRANPRHNLDEAAAYMFSVLSRQ